ncbi:hypothetical protein [Dyella sp.]|jgi:hypothetical protein|uniref:hypothetical protein n=1 Tax=Dyella sp. TaxID=1869338 RepID=UPI002FD89B2C
MWRDLLFPTFRIRKLQRELRQAQSLALHYQQKYLAKIDQELAETYRALLGVLGNAKMRSAIAPNEGVRADWERIAAKCQSEIDRCEQRRREIANVLQQAEDIHVA